MQNSKIEWTHHTFNPWWGCQRVSPGCEHCYAETLANRYGHNVWGPAKTTTRRMMSENYWKQPHRWNKAAAAAGERHRVFCASMADVFEDHPDVVEARWRLFNIILMTPHLDWLLLTKRPENIKPMLQAMPVLKRDNVWDHLWPHHFPNVWIGTSVEDQRRADERIPELLKVPARVRFLSCEPLLGPVDLEQAGAIESAGPEWAGYNSLIDWCIVGGESGPNARSMRPDWARSLRDQCVAAGVAFHFKQWGESAPRIVNPPVMTKAGLKFPDKEILTRVGKKAAGRSLDGQTWDELPA